MKKLNRATTAALALLVIVAGCSTARLEPTRQLGPQSHAALEQASGVQVMADPQAWQGQGTVTRTVTPVEIFITNQSGRTLYRTRSDITMVAPGQIMRALPPRSVKLRPQRTTVGMSPTDGDIYSDLGTQITVPDDRASNDSRSLRQELVQAALADGPVANGQSVRGFVYFDRLPKQIGQIDLQVGLRETPDGPPVTVLHIPFRVVR
jgi:hypothetical protein